MHRLMQAGSSVMHAITTQPAETTMHAKTEPGTAAAAPAPAPPAPSAVVVAPQPQPQARRGIQPTHARMRLNLISTPSSASPKPNGPLHTPTNGRPSHSPVPAFASAAAAAQRSPNYSTVRQALAAASSPPPVAASPSPAVVGSLGSPPSARYNRLALAAAASAAPHIWQPISVPLTAPMAPAAAPAAAAATFSANRSPGAPVKNEAVTAPAFPSPLRAALAVSAATAASASNGPAAVSAASAPALPPSEAPVSPVLEDNAFPSLEDDDDPMQAGAAAAAPAIVAPAVVSPFVSAPSIPAAAAPSRSFFDEFDDGDDAMAEAAMSAQLDRVQEQRRAAASAAVASPARVKMEDAAAKLAGVVGSSSLSAAAAGLSSPVAAAAAPALSSASAAVPVLSSAAAAAIADFSDLAASELEEMLTQLPAPMPPLDTSAPAYAFGPSEDEPAYLHGLNTEQRQAVLAPPGPLLILACAGSGKCWGAATKLMMFDGRSKRVPDIRVGDQLMGDDGTPRTVLSLSRGHTGEDADRPAVLMPLKIGHVSSRHADGKFYCKYVGCAHEGTEIKSNRDKHEGKEHLHMTHAVESATYRITSNNPGRNSWTCNMDHILVLKFNRRPGAVQEHTGRNRTNPFSFQIYTTDAEGLVIISAPAFPGRDSAVVARENALAKWEPLVWEGPVHQFLRFGAHVQRDAQMFSPPRVRFGQAGPALRQRLAHAIGGALPSKALTQLVAWAIGMWLTDGTVATTRIDQIKEDQNLAADGHDKSHTPVVQRLKLVYEQITGQPAGEDEEPEEEDAEPGIDEDAVMDQLIEEGKDEDEAKAEVDGLMENAEAEAAPRGIVQFDQYSSAGNPVYRIHMGVVFRRLLESYKILRKKRIPHSLLSESTEVRMSLLAGIIDGDGHAKKSGTLEVSAKKRRFIDGLVHLARGLGFSTGKVGTKKCVNEETGQQYRGRRVHIGGENVHTIPTVLLYKRLPQTTPNKDQRCDGFTIEKIGDRKYYGFTLSGNGRCLMDDFVVTHNTKTIERRIMRLIVSGLAQASQILAITFTKKAATELRDRVNRAMDAGLALTAAAAAGAGASVPPALSSSSSRDITVCNFHQLALRTLGTFWREAGFPVPVQVLGKKEQRLLLLEVLRAWRADQDRTNDGSRAARRMHNEIITAITSDRVLGALLSEAIQKELTAASDRGSSSGAPRSYHPNSREAKMMAMGEDPERSPFTAPRAAAGGSARPTQTQTQGGSSGSKDPLTREEHSIIGYFLAFIRRAKTAKHAPSFYTGVHRSIYGEYVARSHARGLVELDDLVSRLIELLDVDDRVRHRVQAKYRHVLVDEYQDVNAEQFLLLRILGGLDPTESVQAAASKPPPSIACVGDDDQSIYSWRGSLVHSFLLFTQSYPTAHSITLSRTYRHTQTIVHALSSLIAHNKVRTPKALTTLNPQGVPIEFMMCNDTVTEARRIAVEIRRLTGSAPEDVAARAQAESAAEAPKEPLLRLKDIAILSRTRRPLELLHKVLTDNGIPCNSPSLSLQQSKELEREKAAKEKSSLAARKKHAQALKSSKLVMDVLAYAELIASAQDTEAGPNSTTANDLRAADPSSDLAQLERKRADSLNQAFRRVVNLPRRGIGRATLGPVEELAAKFNVTLLRAARVLCGLDPHARKFTDAHSMNASSPKLDAKHRDLLRPFLELLVKFQRLLTTTAKGDVPLSVTDLLSRLLDKKLHTATTKAEEEEPLNLLVTEAQRFDRENAVETGGDPASFDLDDGMVAAAASQAAQVAAGNKLSFISASAAAAAAAATGGASRDAKRKIISVDSDDEGGASMEDDFMEQKSGVAAGGSGKKQKQEHRAAGAAAAAASAAAAAVPSLASPASTVSLAFSSPALQSLRTFIREVRAGGSFSMLTPNSTTTGGGSSGSAAVGGKDDETGGANCVWLNTIHQSKGLEWPMVILVSFNDGHMPLPTRAALMEDESTTDPAASLVSPSQQVALLAASAAAAPSYGRYTLPASPSLSVDADEEERRLAYVAMSRAKRHLLLSCVLTNSDGMPAAPSPFLAEIPENLIHCHNKSASAAAALGGDRSDDFTTASKHHAAASAVAAAAASAAGVGARIKTETKPSFPAAAVAAAAASGSDSKMGLNAASADDVTLIGSARKSKPGKSSVIKSEAGSAAAASSSRSVKAEPSSEVKKKPVSEALKLSRAARAQAKKDTKERESKPWLADFQSAFESAPEPLAPEQANFLATWNPNAAAQTAAAANAGAAAAAPATTPARSAPAPAGAAAVSRFDDEMDDDAVFCLDVAPSASRSTPAKPPAAVASSLFSPAPSSSQAPRSSPPPAAASKAARLSPAVPSAAAASAMYSHPLTLSAQIAAQRSAHAASTAAAPAAPPRASNLPLSAAASAATQAVASRHSSQFMSPARPNGSNGSGMSPTLKREGIIAPAAASVGQTAGKENPSVLAEQAPTL